MGNRLTSIPNKSKTAATLHKLRHIRQHASRAGGSKDNRILRALRLKILPFPWRELTLIMLPHPSAAWVLLGHTATQDACAALKLIPSTPEPAKMALGCFEPFCSLRHCVQSSCVGGCFCTFGGGGKEIQANQAVDGPSLKRRKSQETCSVTTTSRRCRLRTF